MLPSHVILRGLETLPIIPEVVARLTLLLNDKALTYAGFEQAVKYDPVLTANLLQAANGAYKTGSAPITTLDEAVERIGMHRLLEVAVGSSLRRTLPARIPGYGIKAGKFWIHCIAVATIAELIARRIELPSVGMAFTAGLMHDVGQLAIGDFFAENMPESDWWTFGTPAEERALLSCNHCDVGKAVAERWKLPQAVVDTCRWHHELEQAPESIDTPLNTVIHAADALAYVIGFNGVGYPGEVMDALAPARLGLSEDELIDLAKDARQEIGRNAIASGMGSSLDQVPD